MEPTNNSIRFKHNDLITLRQNLLNDLSKEYFAILLAKTHIVDGNKIITVHEIKYPSKKNYKNQSQAFLRMDKGFIFKQINEIIERYDLDTIIDVHTHPFSENDVYFSSVDDSDEINFFKFLTENFENINYASIVFSQNNYSARILTENRKKVFFDDVNIYTQTSIEDIEKTHKIHNYRSDLDSQNFFDKNNFHNRSVLTLGLDNMRKIMDNQIISIVGVGGLGSIIAEHLVHMGFNKINLIDFDKLEVSNLNRIVGAYYSDAIKEDFKVDVIKKHLIKINPNVEINAFRADVSDKNIENILAFSNWIIVATDNHSSRLISQEISLKYFVPMITAGVNITVNNNSITDMSGEVITVKAGERICLHCLKRLNHSQIAYETANEQQVRDRLIKGGYVTGKDVKEPAVKTLNTMLATILVNNLINHYTNRQKHQSITIYENNLSMSIYEDKESIENRDKNCNYCDI